MVSSDDSDCKIKLAFVPKLVLLLAFVSAGVTLIVGVLLGILYVNTKHFSEVTTPCTVVQVERSGLISCSFSDSDGNTGYFSKYPCLVISVNYTDTESGEIITNGTLFDRSSNYESSKKDGCSIYSCDKDEDSNVEEVAEFERKYGSLGQTFPCHPGSRLSDPEAITSVIHLWHVIIGVLIPSSVFFASSIYLVYYFMFSKTRINVITLPCD